jgi:hypothetical protein
MSSSPKPTIGGGLIDRPIEHAIHSIELALKDCREFELALLREPPLTTPDARVKMRQRRRHTLRRIAEDIAVWQRDDGAE